MWRHPGPVPLCVCHAGGMSTPARDPGDAWVVMPTGERHWGLFGAAGLLALDAERGVLLQHRVSWSHHGGTWALPGGARHQHESAYAAALRESAEEAGVPAGSVTPRFTHVLDLDLWSYTTVIVDVIAPFEPVISDPESYALVWTPIAEVDLLPLHPSFAAAWPGLRALLDVRPALVIDGANVVGSVPDGWWRDRAGAAERLRQRLETFATTGVDAEALGLPGDRWFAEITLVVEGQARAIEADAELSSSGVRIVRAPRDGDTSIVAEASALVGRGRSVTVVTSDRELGARAIQARASVRGAGWLRDLLG